MENEYFLVDEFCNFIFIKSFVIWAKSLKECPHWNLFITIIILFQISLNDYNLCQRYRLSILSLYKEGYDKFGIFRTFLRISLQNSLLIELYWFNLNKDIKIISQTLHISWIFIVYFPFLISSLVEINCLSVW